MDDLSIRGIDGLLEPRAGGVVSPPGNGDHPGFSQLLKGAIEEVNRIQHEAGRLEDAVARGENINIHQAIIAGEKAGLSFQLMMKVRNKLLEAYQEIARMQV